MLCLVLINLISIISKETNTKFQLYNSDKEIGAKKIPKQFRYQEKPRKNTSDRIENILQITY
jgi:4-hydroxybenzoate polyprenyltransferase